MGIGYQSDSNSLNHFESSSCIDTSFLSLLNNDILQFFNFFNGNTMVLHYQAHVKSNLRKFLSINLTPKT